MNYIRDSLATGFIHPSPTGAGLFFVEKKDKTLPPCIDYRGLNDITVKNRYLPPLISSDFEPFQVATVSWIYETPTTWWGYERGTRGGQVEDCFQHGQRPLTISVHAL